MNNIKKKIKKNSKSLSKYIRWAIIILIIAIIGFFLYTKLQPSKNTPNYITALVVKGDIEDTVMASGKVKAIKSVNVGAQVSGEITKLYVNVGDVVKKGDPIAQIDQINQQNQLTKRRATSVQSMASLETAQANLYSRTASMQGAQEDLKTATANLAMKKTELATAKGYLKRINPLVEIAAISQTDFDNAQQAVISAKNAVASAESRVQGVLATIESKKADITSAKANVASQQASVEKSKMDVNTASKLLSNTTIIAPMGGTVVKVLAEQGTTVNANQLTPTIVTLADLSRIRINAQISETDVNKVQVGMPVTFNMIGSPDDKNNAILSGIEPAPASTHAAVYYVGYIEATNPDNKFRIDMTAQLEIITQQVKEGLVIPSAAIKKMSKVRLLYRC